MSSSDSDDFESADEDVVSVKLPDKELCDDKTNRNLKEYTECVKSVVQPLDNLKIEHIKDEEFLKDSIPDSTNESFNTKIPKINKKLGTKLTENETIKSYEFDDNRLEDQHRQHSNDFDSETCIKKIEKIEENVDPTRKPSAVTKDSVVENDCKKSNKGDFVGLSEVKEGWDFEEEDGFQFSDDTPEISHQETMPHVNSKGLSGDVPVTRLSAKQSVDGWELDDEDGIDILDELEQTTGDMIQGRLAENTESKAARTESETTEEGSWSGWGGWGVSSLLSTATESVTAGLSTVLESTVGAPAPETLAAQTRSEDRNTSEGERGASYGGLGSLVSGVGMLGSTVITRGLDTLETLGKKTMEVLQDGDPRLMRKRAMLFPNQDKPVLSQILREAKEKADNSDKEKEEKETARKAHFESLFDDFHGMVHLEALEMLSRQCEIKLQSMLLEQSGAELEDLRETLAQVRDLCELPEDEEEVEALSQEQFTAEVSRSVQGLGVNISPAKIIQVNDKVVVRLADLNGEPVTSTVVNQTAVSSLAEFTAAGMECFHKSAELLLAKQTHHTADEADSYIRLTTHLCARVSAMANEFTQLLTKNHPIANSSLITNIFLEASNSCSYIKNACQLLVPVVQEGAVSSPS